MVLESALGWYQGRISLYDKQAWETTVEQRILQGLSYTPRKTAKLKTELIDVDLVRGSTFPKAKPQSGLWFAGLHGIVRLILLPMYTHWWIRETSCGGFLVVLLIYSSILVSGAIMISSRHDETLFEDVPVSEVLLPAVVFIVMSVIHSQIVCTRHSGISSPSHTSIPVGMRQARRIRSMRRSASLTGRGKCIYCRSSQSDSSRTHNNKNKKQTSIMNSRPSFKNFRSHSEEPRPEEFFPIRPRSASENNVSPSAETNIRPSIIIFQSTNNEHLSKENITLSSSPATSSSDRSPIIGVPGVPESHAETGCEHLETRQNIEKDIERVTFSKEIIAPNHEGDILYSSSSSIKQTKSGDVFQRNSFSVRQEIPSTVSDNVDNGGSCPEWSRGIPLHRTSMQHLKIPKQRRCEFDVGSDGGEESGMGDLEAPTTDTDNWNMRLPDRCLKCTCRFRQLPDTSVTHSSRRSPHKLPSAAVERSSCNSSCESDAEQSPSLHYKKAKLTDYEWMGITTNSDDLSYSSESEGGWDDTEMADKAFLHTEALDWNIQGSPAAIITSTPTVSDKVSCKIWEGAEVKKVDLSVLDISSAVISKVDSLHHTTHYLQFGLTMAIMIALVPILYRLDYAALNLFLEALVTCSPLEWLQALRDVWGKLLGGIFGSNLWATSVILLGCVNRFCLAAGFFFLLSVAERTFKQRFLYAKHFCYLTSARRARKYDLPHFRLNKVHNIKTWLSVRSCLKKRGPQRSVDVIVSATFFITLLLVSYLCFELLKEDEKTQHSLYNCELFVWCFAIGIYLIRFMTLGAMINKKYSSLSVLITEQINMYLHMEQKPQKKEELMLANNVLKLVSVLLKELESPFKISGLSANPLLYNVTRLVVLSACSGVLSELLGFKLKLHKIKFKE